MTTKRDADLRRFDKIMAVVLILLALGTVAIAVIGEQRRDQDVSADAQRFADQEAALKEAARLADERAKMAEALAAEAARTRDAVVALALADSPEERRAALGLLGAGPAAAPGPATAEPTQEDPEGTRTGPRASQPPSRSPGPQPEPEPEPEPEPAPAPIVPGALRPVVPDEVEQPVESTVRDALGLIPCGCPR